MPHKEGEMSKPVNTTLDVRIVSLEPLRVAAALGFGASPEAQAWEKLLSWARAEGVLQSRPAPRFLGFNNPSPTPGSPNYGYEQWVTVGPEACGSAEVTIRDFPGGLYAVTRCTLANIGEAWQQLVSWAEDSRYEITQEQCLEECLDALAGGPETSRFDLYLAVRDR
jgi:DNA gyrase inhibitor GyrI